MAVLTCPECDAKFLIADSALPPEGRKVKCTACTNIWLATPEKVEAEEPQEVQQTREIPDGINPRKRKKPKPKTKLKKKLSKKTVSYLVSVSIFFIMLATFALFHKSIESTWPKSRSAFSMIGIESPPPAYGLVFDRLEASKDEKHIKIKGYIINLEDKIQTIPQIEAVLMDKNHKEYDSLPINIKESDIEAQGSIQFDKTFDANIAPSSSITVRFVLF